MRSSFFPLQLWAGVLSLALCLASPLAQGAGQGLRLPGDSGGAAAPLSVPSPATPAAVPAAPPSQLLPQQPDQFVDGIAAVVNKDVITMRELRDAVKGAAGELSRQGVQLPDPAVLQRQVLERLITVRLEHQEADRLKIKVDGAAINQAINDIAARNKIGVDQMRAEVQKTGITWDDYRRNISDEILADRLRQRMVDADIIITDSEVDAFLKEQQRRQGGTGSALGATPGANAAAPAPQAPPPPSAASSGPVQVALAQILVRVPDNSSPQQVAALRKKAEGLLARVKGGEDFATVAASSSDGPEAQQGGMMGARLLNDWPDLFINAIANLHRGDVSGLIQSGNGFHILKVVDRAGGAPAPSAPQTPAQQAAAAADPLQQPSINMQQGPMQVTQTHARHILIKTSAVMSDSEARQRLELLRQRIVTGGEDFATLARQNSQDASAPQGGDLGWLNPGETVPPFDAAMNALKVGEVSQPIQSPFGWHLIQVLERRQKDVADEMQRLQARRILFERRAEPAFEDYLDRLRDQAYIDNRLEKKNSQDSNPR